MGHIGKAFAIAAPPGDKVPLASNNAGDDGPVRGEKLGHQPVDRLALEEIARFEAKSFLHQPFDAEFVGRTIKCFGNGWNGAPLCAAIFTTSGARARKRWRAIRAAVASGTPAFTRSLLWAAMPMRSASGTLPARAASTASSPLR